MATDVGKLRLPARTATLRLVQAATRFALVWTLAFLLSGSGISAVAAVPPVSTTHVTAYNVAFKHSNAAAFAGADSDVNIGHAARTDAASGRLPQLRSVVVAAETATTGGRSVDEVLSGLSKGKNSGVWTVPDQSTLQSTFDELTQGGTSTTWKDYNGTVYELPDGTQIGMRSMSSLRSGGGPTIDIRVPGQDPSKIHIG